jgi:hypothetical protein
VGQRRILRGCAIRARVGTHRDPVEDGHLDVNVGWLSDAHEHTRGRAGAELVGALLKCATRPVRLHRGFHTCELCPAEGTTSECTMLRALPTREPSALETVCAKIEAAARADSAARTWRHGWLACWSAIFAFSAGWAWSDEQRQQRALGSLTEVLELGSDLGVDVSGF